jgi:hypothetical protein
MVAARQGFGPCCPARRIPARPCSNPGFSAATLFSFGHCGEKVKGLYVSIEFEILGTIKPSVNGKNTYQRVLIRRIPPKEKVISICDLCEFRETDRSECENCEIEAIIL